MAYLMVMVTVVMAAGHLPPAVAAVPSGHAEAAVAAEGGLGSRRPVGQPAPCPTTTKHAALLCQNERRLRLSLRKWDEREQSFWNMWWVGVWGV